MRCLLALVLVAACARGSAPVTSPAPATATTATTTSIDAGAPPPAPTSVSPTATPTCPGDLDGDVCDVYKMPTCAPDQHVRVVGCQPVCVAIAACTIAVR